MRTNLCPCSLPMGLLNETANVNHKPGTQIRRNSSSMASPFACLERPPSSAHTYAKMLTPAWFHWQLTVPPVLPIGLSTMDYSGKWQNAFSRQRADKFTKLTTYLSSSIVLLLWFQVLQNTPDMHRSREIFWPCRARTASRMLPR